MASRAHIKGLPSKHQRKQHPQKSGPKQPLGIPERLKRLFTSLCAQIEGGHFTNALKTCDKILQLESNDVEALQTKLFLLLQTEQYDAALSLIGDKSRHAFAQAYSYYRLQREVDARDILKTIKEENEEDDRGVVHLDAQLSYREGSYQTAFELYNQLLDTAEPQSEEHSDIITNLQASQQHLDFIERGFLHALDTLPTSLTSNIESHPPPAQPNAQVAATSPLAASASKEPTKAVEKKTRMSRIPAGVIPGVTPLPDPERWLKKSERSTFGQGRKRKGPAGGGGATQGIASVDSAPPTAAPSHATKSGGSKGKKRK